ncbi:DUF2057 domain-containing protein [Shewanella aestuarii]|uniref:DUF2057 domain-containing protein n=1 Tax=Shewanella aestuarii TaxID=1028752 RepID=A0A6G9QHW4_9GAMM|nr:DUF2057 domain-containing protein [Shewanella aestuarii]QIR14130.1 DUF2057 domain-containing protein [Shewanella aestuarii]
MKSFVTTSAIVALLSSTSIMAANLTIPMSFEYLALNGQQIETNRFTHKSDISLDKGNHKIAIRYHDMVEDQFSDSPSFIKSSPFIITLEVDGDYQYFLTPAEGEVIKRPQEFAKNPQVVISRKGNGQVSYSVEQTDFKEGSFFSNLFGNNKGNDIDDVATRATSSAPVVNNAQSTQAVTTTVAATAIDVNTPTTPAVATVSQTTTQTSVKSATEVKPAQAEQMLQYWWLQADEQTRKEFMSWAIKQL